MRPNLLLVLLLAAVAPGLAETTKPNILLIAVDDLRPELGCYGSATITPNIDRLAANGIRFDRAYANQAVCGPSRISLLSGLYPEFTGLRAFNVPDWRNRLAGVTTLNAHLRKHGYFTVGLGKVYHERNAKRADGENWDRWFNLSQPDYLLPENVKLDRENRKIGKVRGPSTEAADVPDDAYLDGKRAKVAAEILDQLGGAKEGPLEMGERRGPFFLAVGFQKPHLPFVAPKKYWDLYQRESFSLPPTLAVPPGYPRDASNFRPGELYNYCDIPSEKLPPQYPGELNQLLIHGYHAAVSYMDANVGRVLDALERNGFADDTIVILWSDHGWKLGDHSSWTKHTNFEVDTRVPLIVCAPRVAARGGKSDALVELIDLYPTLCDLAGLPHPPQLQGRSFADVLAHPDAPKRESAYSSFPATLEGTRTIGHSIRTDRYRYTEWWDDQDAVVDAVATDLTADPGETTATANEGVLKELRRELHHRVTAARTPPEA